MLGAGLLAGLFILLAAPAKAGTWCIRDAGSPPPGACVFPVEPRMRDGGAHEPFRGHLRARTAGIRDR